MTRVLRVMGLIDFSLVFEKIVWFGQDEFLGFNNGIRLKFIFAKTLKMFIKIPKMYFVDL